MLGAGRRFRDSISHPHEGLEFKRRMNDPVEDIAVSVAAYLDSVKGTSTTESFVTVKTDDPNEYLYAEQNELLVLVVPFGESAERIGRNGQALESYQINVMVVRKLNG